MKTTREIGARIRRRRTEWGFTQSELAGATGIDRVKIAKIESGDRDVKVDEGMAIARMLDLTVEDLFRTSAGVRYRLDGENATTRRSDEWFDKRIEYSLLVRDLGAARAAQS